MSDEIRDAYKLQRETEGAQLHLFGATHDLQGYHFDDKSLCGVQTIAAGNCVVDEVIKFEAYHFKMDKLVLGVRDRCVAIGGSMCPECAKKLAHLIKK
ncbi:MAG: hypothetical protein IJ228_04285 [Succinivibrio sp.]|nr:hypothetical protein [Succinivibrio sp.]